MSHCPKPGFKDLILTLPKSQNNLLIGRNCILVISLKVRIIKKKRSVLKVSFKGSTQIVCKIVSC